MQEEPGAEQVPSLDSPKAAHSHPIFHLTPSPAKGISILPQDSPWWPTAPSVDLIIIENQLWQQFSG